jgi:hypothetical protein
MNMNLIKEANYIFRYSFVHGPRPWPEALEPVLDVQRNIISKKSAKSPEKSTRNMNRLLTIKDYGSVL